MELYVTRMMTEKTDLEGKIKKAKKAIIGNPYGMTENDKHLLEKQIEYMESYLEILSKRIDLAKTK